MSEIKKESMCRNCSSVEHKTSKCREPIQSFGIILINSHKNILYVKRRDTLAFMLFVKGFYTPSDTKKLKIIVQNMTLREKEFIYLYKFNELWNYIWSGHFSNTVSHESDEYKLSKKKFIVVSESGALDKIKKDRVMWKCAEWGFPKGRKKISETGLNAAKRELLEETGYRSEEYTLKGTNIEYIENIIGMDSRHYVLNFYVAYLNCNRKAKLPRSREIGEMKWLSIRSALSRTRFNLFNRRSNLQVLNFIENKELNPLNICIRDVTYLGKELFASEFYESIVK